MMVRMTIFASLLLCCVSYVAINRAYQIGVADGVDREEKAKKNHDAMMRGIGTCEWAELMLRDIMCRRGLPRPAPPKWTIGKPA
jgi:hypothetical protein